MSGKPGNDRISFVSKWPVLARPSVAGFARPVTTGGMRRLYLRGRENVAKRVLIHAAGFNVGLMMRLKYGLPKPRSMSAAAGALILTLILTVRGGLGSIWAGLRSIRPAQRLHRLVGPWRPPLSAA